MIVLLLGAAGAIRSIGAAKTLRIVTLLFTLGHAGGLVALAMGFQKLRPS